MSAVSLRKFLARGKVFVWAASIFLEIGAESATFLVANVNDSGSGSLRQAIIDANASTGLDTITFQITGPGIHTIAPLSALPAITDPVEIDATTQPGYSGQPLIELNGASSGANAGLRLQAGNSTVKGLIINRFASHGVLIDSAGSNVIRANYIGTDSAGSMARGNAGSGILINGPSSNVIGGTNAMDRNVISGNGDNGVYILGSGNNVIQGNYIGTSASGAAKLGNTNNGVLLVTAGPGAATGNMIGGAQTGARNLISGNLSSGVYLNGDAVTGNFVEGNYIGSDLTGANSLANAGDGVTLQFASGNQIGGPLPGAGNVLSGNARSGISFFGGAPNNTVQGNFIGTDPTGQSPLANTNSGITVFNSNSNLIGGTVAAARNLISGNLQDGIFITNCTATMVQGNYIGVNAAGTSPLRNLVNGVEMSGADSNIIGGALAGAGNIISGNSGNGVGVFFASSGNSVLGNYIGVDVNGTSGISNWLCGVRIESGGNTVGGTTAASRNIISGNGLEGVLIVKAAASNNAVQGNYIGTTAAGNAALGNHRAGLGISGASGNLIGGTPAGAGNVISANSDPGASPAVYLAPATNSTVTSGNTIQGNKIGTDSSGNFGLGNTFEGIHLERANTNVIGGTAPGAGNQISGNHSWGIFLTNAAWNTIEGNLVGTKTDGLSALGNSLHAIECESNACNNIIGVNGSGANRIAFSPPGFAGVRIRSGATNNAIRGNAIFSNGALGIAFSGLTATPNDNCDGDAGPNLQQNYPVLTQAVSSATTLIKGTINSKASTIFLLQFFANSACDPSGNGEGEIYLGEITVTTSAGCATNLAMTLPVAVPAGYSITATATDLGNNTSEFSQCLPVVAAPTLTISPTNNHKLTLAWTNTAAAFALKQTDCLAQPIAWSAVTNQQASLGGQIVVTVDVTATNRFYTLMLQ